MQFVLSKTLDHGTSNPIVARTLPQWGELFNFYEISKKQRDDLSTVLHEGVMVRLLACYDIAYEICAKEAEIFEEFQQRGLEQQAGGRVVHLPQIIGLKEKAETFLYQSKSTLRDFAQIFNILFNTTFDECRYDKISTWSENELGADADLSRLLTQDQEWIKQVVKMRNAVEHPGGYSGHLHIHNCQLAQNQNEEKTTLVPPTWHLNEDGPSSITKDMQTNILNILAFTEDVLVVALENFKNNFPILIAEIPETERDPKFPKRLRAIPDPSKIKI